MSGGLRRKKVSNAQRERVIELSSLGKSVAEIETALGAKERLSRSSIYKILRGGKPRVAKEMLKLRGNYSALSNITQRKQLSDFLASLSLPGPYLIRSEDFWVFVEGSTEGMFLKLNRGTCALHYVAPFASHPIFAQAKEIFCRETIWGELDKFTDDFNKLLGDCSALWHDIYNDAKEALDAKETLFPGVAHMVTAIVKEVHKGKETEVTKETLSLSTLLDAPWHHFIPLIYQDAIGWALGKNLTLIKREDYDYGHSGDKKFVVRCQLPDHLLILIEFPHEDESMGFQLAASVRDVHMMLREKYRQSDQVNNLTQAMHRLEVQEESILRSLKQLATVLKTS